MRNGRNGRSAAAGCVPAGPPRRGARRHSSARRRVTVLALLLALVAAACGEIVELEFPDLEAVPRVPPEQSIIYDSEGTQLAVLRQEFRERVDIEALPRHLIDAVVAAEDQRFWIHGGIDARAIARAAASNLAVGGIQQGGSTITQQLVKNLYMPDAERSPETKVREALLARKLEDERSKEEILEEYLNTVYFGNGAYGVQAAAETYWRIDAAELSLARSALLAGLLRAPESLSPERVPEGARRRRDLVLDAMVELGTADAAAAERAKAEPIEVRARPPTPETIEPHWVDFVVRTLLDDPAFGADEAERARMVFGGGLRIHTTLDPRLQAHAREAIATYLPDASDPEAAIVHVEPETGHILAAVGGRDYETSQYHLATQARRQPGSTFKAFVLAAAVTAGYGPEHRVDGSPGTLDTRNGPWRVRNYGGANPGTVTLEDATRHSVNGAFARLMLELGVGRVAGLARGMGVTSPINEDPAIALGGLEHGVTPLDMASAYATLANLGRHVPPTPILRIEDTDGGVVFRPDTRERRALEPSAAFVTTQMLRAAVESGTGTAAQVPGWEVAGKTGTTSDYTDAWFVGYTPTMAASVWMGRLEGTAPLVGVRGFRQVTGGTLPARMWRTYATAALADRDPVGFSLPKEYYEVFDVDPETGLRSAPWCAGEPTAVPRVIAPREVCPSPEPPPPTRTAEPLPLCPTPIERSTPAPAPTERTEPCREPAPESRPDDDPEPTPVPGEPVEPSPTGSPWPDGGSGGDEEPPPADRSPPPPDDDGTEDDGGSGASPSPFPGTSD